jgi:hypothetical protein
MSLYCKPEVLNLWIADVICAVCIYLWYYIVLYYDENITHITYLVLSELLMKITDL